MIVAKNNTLGAILLITTLAAVTACGPRTLATTHAGRPTQTANTLMAASAYIHLGDTLMQKARESMDGHQYDHAMTAYRQALAMEPNSEHAMVGLARVCNSQHDFVESRQWAEKALAIDPKLPDAHALIGDASMELGAYEQAFKHYQDAMDLRPNLASYSRAARLLWLTGQPVKAKQLMERAISAGGPHKENIAWCQAELALMAFHTGSLLIAESHCRLAIKNAPENPHVLAIMGKIKTAKKEYTAAVDLYERAISIAPTHDALVALGDLYALMGKTTEAERQYEQVVLFHSPDLRSPRNGNIHVHAQSAGNGQSPGNAALARFYADHDRNLAEALEQAQLAYTISKSIFTMDTLAWCYFKNGRYEEAKRLMDDILKFKTPDGSILFHAALIHEKLGHRKDARQYLYEALNLNPQFHPIKAGEAANALRRFSVLQNSSL